MLQNLVSEPCDKYLPDTQAPRLGQDIYSDLPEHSAVCACSCHPEDIIASECCNADDIRCGLTKRISVFKTRVAAECLDLGALIKAKIKIILRRMFVRIEITARGVTAISAFHTGNIAKKIVNTPKRKT